MLFLMSLKNKTAKKDLRLAYSQGNSTDYSTNIKAMARYLSTNILTTSPLTNVEVTREIKRRVMNQSLKTRMVSLAILPVHMLKTLPQLKSALLLTYITPSIGTHVLETNIQLFNLLRTVEEILDVRPIDDDDFWGNTNPTDVSIDTANNKEMMTESHITEFHTSKQEEPVTTKLLNKALNVPGLIGKREATGGHHNQSDRRSAKHTDYKLNIYEDLSFSSNKIEKEDVAKKWGKPSI